MTRPEFDILCLSLGMTADGPFRFAKGRVRAWWLGGGRATSYARLQYGEWGVPWETPIRRSVERLRADLEGWG
jgi:hypothetical protein